ncbi:hypothetical protein EI94DRAFT_1029270 [Lactarius quietus]|nr:hypothetical protein EI94DRAFT_1029270 [Lactarius quietus]
MQRFTVVLFALVAVFAIVFPSSANALSHVKRETNAERFARGLTPLKPSTRSTAKRYQNSQVSVPGRTGRIQARDHGNGHSYGYLQNGPSGPYVGGINHGNNPHYSDLSVQYNPGDHSLFCDASQGFYLGAPASSQNLGPSSTNHVTLTGVNAGNTKDEVHIWSVDASGKLTCTWENSDGSTVPVNCAYHDASNSLYLVGDIDDFCDQNPGWKYVVRTSADIIIDLPYCQ